MRLKWNRLSDAERCYLAGFFDGEGCVSATRNRSAWVLRVSVSNTDLAMLRRFASVFGGRIYLYKKRARYAKDAWQWVVNGADAALACVALRPYLRGKRRQAAWASRWEASRSAHEPGVRRRREALGRKIESANDSSWLRKRRAAGKL